MRKNKTGIKKKRKVIIRIVLTIFLVVIVILGTIWNRYLNKNSLIASFESPQNQDVYLLGTFHDYHFNKWVNYSMEDLLSVVENIKPDVVFIEAREENFLEYGVVDGPIDMSVIYSYCIENDINVEMIDWWEVNNEAKANSTNELRDDNIFSNIENKLNMYGSDIEVLVVCGAGHYYEQTERFLSNGYEKLNIEDKSVVFLNDNENFEYPEGLEEIWDNRSYFYAYTHSRIIRQDELLNEDVADDFSVDDSNAKDFYEQQLEFCELFLRNELYK